MSGDGLHRGAVPAFRRMLALNPEPFGEASMIPLSGRQLDR